MSNLFAFIGRLIAAVLAPRQAPADPDQLSLQDWADLPHHHPSSERAPC